MIWYISAFKNYFNFRGRARRKEYWMFALFSCIIAAALAVVDGLLGLQLTDKAGILGTLYSLAIWFPSLALLFRRLHDIGKSAWWLCLSLIPVVGWIWLLVYLVRDGNIGPNRYGMDPKAGQ